VPPGVISHPCHRRSGWTTVSCSPLFRAGKFTIRGVSSSRTHAFAPPGPRQNRANVPSANTRNASVLRWYGARCWHRRACDIFHSPRPVRFRGMNPMHRGRRISPLPSVSRVPDFGSGVRAHAFAPPGPRRSRVHVSSANAGNARVLRRHGAQYWHRRACGISHWPLPGNDKPVRRHAVLASIAGRCSEPAFGIHARTIYLKPPLLVGFVL
jgi:hypothetical protein